MNPVAAPERSRAPTRDHEDSAITWRDRSALLYIELQRPAREMIRRAFRNAFDDAEIEDIYGAVWLGTLRSLERRQSELSDEELRCYVLTAVANQATKELRRRGRRPTAPLDAIGELADRSSPPDERATRQEESRLARDLLVTLPPRRRAVMLFRYGWGLEPSEVCRLVEGLSPRAYRREITRGVDELTDKLKLVERGEWCADREPILKAYVAGLADVEQQRQAKHHLSHCRHCADFVSKLSGHLHDLGGSLVLTGAADAIQDGRLGLVSQASELLDRVRESTGSILGRSTDGSAEAAGGLASSGAARGSGAAGAGALAKLAGASAAAKLTAACLGAGAAATACIAAGVVPGVDLGSDGDASGGRTAEAAVADVPEPAPEPPPVGGPPPSGADGQSSDAGVGGSSSPPSEPTSPVAPTAPPVQQEFGVAAAASSGDGSSGSGGGGRSLDSGGGGSGGSGGGEFVDP
jgi:RNA polymerase sigma factor (sigma-70 family)